MVRVVERARAAQRARRLGPVPDWPGASGSSSSGSAELSSGGETKILPDWERRAQDAERRGDYAAADRFRSGSTSLEDQAKYW